MSSINGTLNNLSNSKALETNKALGNVTLCNFYEELLQNLSKIWILTYYLRMKIAPTLNFMGKEFLFVSSNRTVIMYLLYCYQLLRHFLHDYVLV